VGKGVGAEVGVGFETTGWGLDLEFRARYVPPIPKSINRITISSIILFDRKDLGKGGGETG